MKYILNYLISFTFILSTIATFNWFIDPFGMNWSPSIQQVNLLKPEAGTRTRITKAYKVSDISPDILIVGNSRVEMGISPHNNIFGFNKVYNLGMPGSHLIMQTDYAIDAIKTTPNIKKIFIGVDFLDFLLKPEKINSPFDELDLSIRSSYSFRLKSHDYENHFPALMRVKEKLAFIFSLDTLSASFTTLFKQRSLASSIDKLGFNSAKSYQEIMKTEGIKPLFTQKLEEISARLSSPLYIAQQQEPLYSPRFIHLKRLIDVAVAQNIEITLFINPYHFSYLHTLAEKGQWHNFLFWKRGLTSYIHSLNHVNVTLWDFSGFSPYINEAVPLTTPKSPMNWFWEPAHYRQELGEKILDKILNEGEKTFSKFGRRLNSDNIDDIIAKDQEGLDRGLASWKLLKESLFIKTGRPIK